MKKLIFFLSLSISFFSLTHKDNAEFKGKVVDDQTGHEIPYAQVVHE